jgi:hypothetical protein
MLRSKAPREMIRRREGTVEIAREGHCVTAPKVFVSYSHDSDAHKQWVQRLATDLRSAGVDASLDQWDLAPGQDIVAFMTTGISNADRVILVCSEEYVRKAEAGKGGVGFERLIVTSELVQTIDTKKFLPLVRRNVAVNKIPNFLGPRLYIDFSIDGEYEARLEQLVREIHGTPSPAKPPLGLNPFGGRAPAVTTAARLAGPSGLTAGGEPILDDEWFRRQEEQANAGVSQLTVPGAMELRFALHDPVSKSQVELLNAMRHAQIQTFGWPIGVILENHFRPRPVPDGIVAEVALPEGKLSGKPSYDYWALRSNGDFYLVQSLFEDDRASQKIFVDTRTVRVTESLMVCASLYESIGVTEDAPISIRITHRGLKGRTLATASPNRMVTPATSIEDVSSSQLQASIAALRQRLADHVVQIVEPLFMLFDFERFDRRVYDEIVRNFQAGRVA